MADITETPNSYPAAVYKIVRTDAADAGANQDGPLNLAPVALVNRTRFLKDAIDAVVNGLGQVADNVTPGKLLTALTGGFAASLGATGYIKLPNWLGGWMAQWGGATCNASGNGTITFPLAFPTVCASTSLLVMSNGYITNTNGAAPSTTGVAIYTQLATTGSTAAVTTLWIAVGN